MSRASKTCQLSISAVSLLRCPHIIKPKRIQAPKIIASCYHKVLNASRLSPSISWFFTDEPELARDKLPFLENHEEFIVSSLSPLPFFLDLICKLDKPVALLSYGDITPPVTSLLTSYSESLQQIHPELQEGLLQTLKNIYNSKQFPKKYAKSFEQSFVLQDRPGKMIVWNLWEEARKGAKRKYNLPPSSDRSPEGSQSYFFADRGWGASCAFLATHKGEEENSKPLKLHYTSFEFKAGKLDLDLPAVIVNQILGWLADRKQSPTLDLKHINIIAPTLPIVGALQSAFKAKHAEKKDSFYFPDFIFGWSPLLTLIEFLVSSEKGSLLVDASHFPSVSALYLAG